MGRTKNPDEAPTGGQPAKRKPRERGEGSVWQEKKTGRWWYAISVNGKQDSYRAPDEPTAHARLKQLKEERKQGMSPGRAVRLGEFAQTWMEKHVANLKPKTQRFYRQTTEHYILPLLGERMVMKKVDAEQVTDMINHLRRAGYAEQTVYHAYMVGRILFEFAHNWGKIPANPFRKIKLKKPKPVEPEVLSSDELHRLRTTLDGHRLAAIYELAWTLGLRLGEALGVALDNIDLQNATIQINQQVQDLDTGTKIVPYTKNDETRTLPLTPRLLALIRQRMAQLLKERGTNWKEHGLLFPSLNGTPMSQHNLSRQMKAACVSSGLRLVDTGKKTKRGKPIYTSEIYFHLFRHTCISALTNLGVNDPIIMVIAGHHNNEVTRRYQHINMDALREAITRMEQTVLKQNNAPAKTDQASEKVG